MRVSISKNVVAAMPQETELDKIVYMMEFSQELCTRTQVYRQNLAWGHKKKVKNMKITRFPAFTPCAIMFEGKTRQDVVGLTDLCYLDIDRIKDDRKVNEALEILRGDSHVVIASKSVSEKGIHILIRYQLAGMETPPQRVTMGTGKMQELYEIVFDYLAGEYKQKLGLEIDSGARHMEHLFIVSYDPDIYYNANAEPIVIQTK